MTKKRIVGKYSPSRGRGAKAVFLDRDGVINREMEAYVFRSKDFEILPDVAAALSLLQKNGYLLIIITNQSGIGRGLYKKTDVERLHKYLRRYLKESGITLSEIYYCCHHPVSGNCICRKPDSLLVEKAAARFKINVEESWFIGDKERDVLAGEKAGVRGILMEGNSSLLSAIKRIPGLKFRN